MADFLEVTVFGRKIPLKAGRDDAEYVRRVVDFVNEHLDDVQRRQPGLSDVTVAILAALDIADQCLSTRERQRSAFAQIEEHCDEVLSYIDSKL
ncbi:cell division protein ZapA [bacterium]|nr:cell division protein ZapA [bacterium]